MFSPPITVALATPRLQLFENLDRHGLRTVPVSGDMPAADIVVFPAGTSKVFLESVAAAHGLPERLRADCASGRTRVVVDASSEGVEHHPNRTRLVHEIVEAAGAPLALSSYVTQEINYRREYDAHCDGLGLAARMRVLHHDAWIWRYLQQFEDTGAEVLAERVEAFRNRPSVRPRRLVSMNFTPRTHKVLFLLRLLADDLWNASFVSFGGVQRYAEIYGAKDDAGVIKHLAALPGFGDMAQEMAAHLPQLKAFGRQFLDPPNTGAFDPHRDATLAEYSQSWFAVVTETEMQPRPSRITEKSMRPLVNLEPFVVLGNPLALSAIRDLGFHTFGAVIDEGYDEILDPRERFEAAYAEVLRLGRMSDAEWASMEQKLEDTLIANAEWGLTGMPTSARRAAFAALVGRIVAP